jgi:hypothetical protein
MYSSLFKDMVSIGLNITSCIEWGGGKEEGKRERGRKQVMGGVGGKETKHF